MEKAQKWLNRLTKGAAGNSPQPRQISNRLCEGDMSAINRFSSRRQRLDHAFLSVKLQGAKSYKRIAGYFRSSIFELVGEEIGSIPKVQIVCNSELDGADHIGVAAQDDFHRSYKDTKRIAPYLPSYAAELKKRDWNDDRVIRRGGIGAKLLDGENLAAEFQRRNYSEEAIRKILGGNMMRVLKNVLR